MEAADDRTRAGYDAVAADYSARFADELAGVPLERALLGVFAELVHAGGPRPVLDLGSGPGHVTAHLASLGLDVTGVDLSPGMVAAARAAHPDVPFRVGTMAALDVPAGSLGGVVAHYSLIHVGDDDLGAVLAGVHRALAPGGEVLLVFQVGEGSRQVTEWFGHAVDLEMHLRTADQVADALTAAGLAVHTRVLRAPEGGTERLPRASVLARRP